MPFYALDIIDPSGNERNLVLSVANDRGEYIASLPLCKARDDEIIVRFDKTMYDDDFKNLPKIYLRYLTGGRFRRFRFPTTISNIPMPWECPFKQENITKFTRKPINQICAMLDYASTYDIDWWMRFVPSADDGIGVCNDYITEFAFQDISILTMFKLRWY